MAGLSGIPFYGAYAERQKQNLDANSQGIRDQVGQMGILAQIQAQQEAKRKLGLDERGRAALSSLSPTATSEEVMGALRPFVSPEHVYQWTQNAELKKAQADQTKQIAMARLSQTAIRDMNEIQHKARTATTAEERLHWTKQMDTYKAGVQRQAQEISAGRYNYDTGGTVTPFQGSIPQASVAGSPGAAQPTIRADMPTDASAQAMALQLAGQGLPVAIRGPQPETVPAVAPTPRGSLAGVDTDYVPPVTGQNMDPRDIMARGPAAARIQLMPNAIPQGEQPSAAPAGPVPAKPTIPEMPPEIASAPRRVQDQWKIQQTRGSMAGAGNFTPQALEFVAKQYLRGDRQAAQGFARNATARIALQNAIVDEAAKQGISPEQTAAQMADFAGTVAGSRAVGQRAANIALAATEAEEMIGIVKETSDNFKRTNFVPWNMAIKAWETGTGTPEIAAFGASINALVNVYARAINPTGQPTVSDKEHARAVINTVQSPAQVDAVLGIIKRELEIAKRAPQTVRASTRQSITGNAPATTTGGTSVSNW